MILFNIPAHKGCQNCGDCCGMIPVSHDELQRIRDYIENYPDIRAKAQQQAHVRDSCPFRDDEARHCLIYPVRPMLCRLMGVTEGMQCKWGNSADIDGHPFIQGYELSEIILLNNLDWMDQNHAGSDLQRAPTKTKNW